MKSYLILLPIAAMMVACGKSEPQGDPLPKGDAIPVRLAPLTAGLVNPVVHAAGRFSTEDETFLAFKTGGVIAGVYVKEGDAIRKGQLLATLRLEEIDAQVQMAKLGQEKAIRDYERASNLHRDSVATLEQLQNAKTGLDLAKSQVEAAQFNRTYSEIRALADGYVLRKLATEGQVVGPGTPVLQTNGAGKGQWVLKIGLSDHDWSRIATGDKARITTDAYPGQVFQAEVARKSEGIDPMSGTFGADLRLLESGALKPASGLFGKAEIHASGTKSSFVIPYSALLDADADSGFVFISPDQKVARRVRVGIQALGHDSVYVHASLPAGSALVVSGSAYLQDGSLIQVQNTSAKQ